MNIDIKYNDELDEFICDLSLTMRLERYINTHFYPAYAISTLAPIYLVGGAIRDLILAKHPKDMDFVVVGKEHLDFVIKALEIYKIEYRFNKFGGFKFNYKGTEIDLWLADDLFSSMQYNVDGLYFDLRTNSVLSLTFEDFSKNGVRLINPENNIKNGRERKLIKFEEDYLNKKYDN